MVAAAALLVGSLPVLGALMSSLAALMLRATGEGDRPRKAVLVALSLLVVVGWWLRGATHAHSCWPRASPR